MVDPKGSSSWLKSLNISDIFVWNDHGEYGVVTAIVIGILVPVLFSALFLGKRRGKVRGVPVEVGSEAGFAVRNARKTELVEVPWEGAPTMAHLFEQSCKKYTQNGFLGTRKLIGREVVTSSNGRRFEKVHLGDYEWETYGEVFARVSNFASGLLKLGHNIDSHVAIFSDTRAEWLIALQGCFRQNITVVTIYASLGEDALVHSLNETQVSTLICDSKQLKKLDAIKSKLSSIQNIIYFEDDSKEEDAFSGSLSNWTIASFNEVEILGKESPVEPSLPSKNSIAVVMYTSGSTGLPKGVMITHGNIVATTAAVMTVIPNLGSKDVYLAYLPLAHVFEMAAESVMLAAGVAIGYGSPLTLTDTSNKIKKGTKGDATVLKPTLLTAVPAILDRIRDGVVKKGILIRNLGFFLDMATFFMALGHYLYIWRLHGMAFHLVDAVLFLNIRALLSAIINRIKGFVRLRIALGALHAALPNATTEELRAYDDECAICREPMAKAKKLNCNHLFHLACLRSWLDQGLTEMYTCPTCRKPLFVGRPENETNSSTGVISSDEQLARQMSAGFDRSNSARHTMPAGLYPNQTLNNAEGVPWRGAGLDSGWLHSWPNQGVDGAGPSTAIRTVGLGRVQLMMRHLASVGETYAQTAFEDASWNLWPINPSQASASGSTIPSSGGGRLPGGTGSLHIRTASNSANDNVANILAMAETVREVLPHIPDDIIFQDLQRTNSVTVTVNNLLQM